MRVLADTCIWSQILRTKSPDIAQAEKLKDLIHDGRVVMIGPVRQEILSGISNAIQFSKLREHLSSFEDIPLQSGHFVKAAEFSNLCRQNGIQGSTTDFLICAVAHLENILIFTSDRDFEKYRAYLPIHFLK
ncbi:MAG: PIN domain-containing protein [Nitrospirota bacterium]